jgi:carbon-monoxide dehydrogenase large subunit
MYIESSGGSGGGAEMAEIRLEPDGTLSLVVGTQSAGQGHATSYAQMVSEVTSVPTHQIRVQQGDTQSIPVGGGTSASRSMPVGGPAVLAAARQIVAKATRIAGEILEVAEADLELIDGRFIIRGTERGLSFAEIARTIHEASAKQGRAGDVPFTESSTYMPDATTYPNGCHVAEVEVDPDTGWVNVVRYTIVDDVGRIINPLLLEGQVHGGTAQGIGQALFEEAVYDHGSGQFLSGSFMDYRMPRAKDFPLFNIDHHDVPSTANVLGVKGAGEAGTIGAPPAIINALIDALSEWKVRHIDMPATPEKIWRAIHDAAGV